MTIRYLIISIVFIGCSQSKQEQPKQEPCCSVEQYPTNLSGARVATVVWYKGGIVQSWYDPIELCDSTFLANRKQEGQKVIDELLKSGVGKPLN